MDELKIGDTLIVWWKPGRDTITDIKRESGKTYAIFAINKIGMTLEDNLLYETI